MTATNRIKTFATGGSVSAPFSLGSPVPSFQRFPQGAVKYCALADTGEWQIATGNVSGTTLTRGTIEETYLGTLDQVNFTGLNLQIAQVLSDADIKDILSRITAVEGSTTEEALNSKVEDKGTWVPGHYDYNDQVSHQSYLMRCINLEGSDQYPIPQTIGAAYNYRDSFILSTTSAPKPAPIYTPLDGGDNIVRSGIVYNFTKPLKLLEVALKIPEVTATTSHKLIVVLSPSSENSAAFVVEVPHLLVDTWTTVYILNTNYPETTEILIAIDAYDSAGTTMYYEDTDYFVDTTESTNIQGFLKIGSADPVYNNSAYSVDIKVQDTTDVTDWQVRASGSIQTSNTVDKPAGLIFFQDTAPTGVLEGDYWINSTTNEFWRYTSNAWISVQDKDIQGALGDASDAQATADGKIVTYAQAEAPTAPTILGVGDLWMDTDDGNMMYRYNGVVWVLYAQDSALWKNITGPGKPVDGADITADNIAKSVFNQGDLALKNVVENLDIADGAVKANNTDIAALNSSTGALAENAVTTGTILDGAISAAKTEIDAINSSTGKLSLKSVPSTALVDGAVTAIKTAINAIDTSTGNLATDSVTTNSIKAGAVSTLSLAALAVSADKIAARTIVASKIATDTITANEIAASTITANEIYSRTIIASNIATNAITADEIKANTITANEIGAGTITAKEIYTGSTISKQVQAEQIYTESLSALNVNLGHCEAGTLDTSGYLRVQGQISVPQMIDDASLIANDEGKQPFGIGGFSAKAGNITNPFNAGVAGIGQDGTATTGILGVASAAGATAIWAATVDGRALYVDGDMETSSSTKVNNLNADRVDNYHAGNSTGQIPVSNGSICTNLNAEKIAGYRAGRSGSSPFVPTISNDVGVMDIGKYIDFHDGDDNTGTDDFDVRLTALSDTLFINKHSYVSGNMSVGSLTNRSDERLKSNIKPIENALISIEKLNGKTFTWNSTGKHTYGFIAQEVQAILPDMIQTERDGMLSIYSIEIVSLLVEAVKELSAEIKLLKEGK